MNFPTATDVMEKERQLRAQLAQDPRNQAGLAPDPLCEQGVVSAANSIRPNFVHAYELTPQVSREIEAAFQYQPWGADQERHGSYVRDALTAAVKVIIDHVPPSADRTAAIRKIREARMDCNSAITHGGRY